jgi:hypothetical protein
LRLAPISADPTESGLDNAGKTTIVKKVMNEDVNTVSPTLGFIIKTIDFQGWGSISCPASDCLADGAFL